MPPVVSLPLLWPPEPVDVTSLELPPLELPSPLDAVLLAVLAPPLAVALLGKPPEPELVPPEPVADWPLPVLLLVAPPLRSVEPQPAPTSIIEVVSPIVCPRMRMQFQPFT